MRPQQQQSEKHKAVPSKKSPHKISSIDNEVDEQRSEGTGGAFEATELVNESANKNNADSGNKLKKQNSHY